MSYDDDSSSSSDSSGDYNDHGFSSDPFGASEPAWMAKFARPTATAVSTPAPVTVKKIVPQTPPPQHPHQSSPSVGPQHLRHKSPSNQSLRSVSNTPDSMMVKEKNSHNNRRTAISPNSSFSEKKTGDPNWMQKLSVNNNNNNRYNSVNDNLGGNSHVVPRPSTNTTTSMTTTATMTSTSNQPLTMLQSQRSSSSRSIGEFAPPAPAPTPAPELATSNTGAEQPVQPRWKGAQRSSSARSIGSQQPDVGVSGGSGGGGNVRPNYQTTTNHSTSTSASTKQQPEWMQKFKQIGMKNSEENVITTQGSVDMTKSHQYQRQIPSSAPTTPTTWRKTPVNVGVTPNRTMPRTGPSPAMHVPFPPAPVPPARTTPTTPNWMNRFDNGANRIQPDQQEAQQHQQHYNVAPHPTVSNNPLPTGPPNGHFAESSYATEDDNDERSVASNRSDIELSWMNQFTISHNNSNNSMEPPISRSQTTREVNPAVVVNPPAVSHLKQSTPGTNETEWMNNSGHRMGFDDGDPFQQQQMMDPNTPNTSLFHPSYTLDVPSHPPQQPTSTTPAIPALTSSISPGRMRRGSKPNSSSSSSTIMHAPFPKPPLINRNGGGGSVFPPSNAPLNALSNSIPAATPTIPLSPKKLADVTMMQQPNFMALSSALTHSPGGTKIGSVPIGTMSAPASPVNIVVGTAKPAWMMKLIQKKKGLPVEDGIQSKGTPPWKRRERLKEEQARKLTEDLGLTLLNIGDDNNGSIGSSDDDSSGSDESWNSDDDQQVEAVPEWMQQFRKMHLKEARVISAQGKAPQKVTSLRNSSAKMMQRTGDIVAESEIIRPITVRSLSSKSLSCRSLSCSSHGRKKKLHHHHHQNEHHHDQTQEYQNQQYQPQPSNDTKSLDRKQSVSTQVIMSAFGTDESSTTATEMISQNHGSRDSHASTHYDMNVSSAPSMFTVDQSEATTSDSSDEKTCLEKKLDDAPKIGYDSLHTKDETLGYDTLHSTTTTTTSKTAWGAQVEIDNRAPDKSTLGTMFGKRVNSSKPGNVTLMSFRKIRNQADRVKERIEQAKRDAEMSCETNSDNKSTGESAEEAEKPQMTFDADESASALFFAGGDTFIKSPTPASKSSGFDNSAARLFGFGGSPVPADKSSSMDNSAANIFGFGFKSPDNSAGMDNSAARMFGFADGPNSPGNSRKTGTSDGTTKLSEFVESAKDPKKQGSKIWDTAHAVVDEPKGGGKNSSNLNQIEEEGDDDEGNDISSLRNKFKSFAEESVFDHVDVTQESDKTELTTTNTRPAAKKKSWLDDSDSESGSDSEDEKPKPKPSSERPTKPLSSFEGVSMVSTATASKPTDQKPLTKKKSWLDDSDSEDGSDSEDEKPTPNDDRPTKPLTSFEGVSMVSTASASKPTVNAATTNAPPVKKKSWLDDSDSDSDEEPPVTKPKPPEAAVQPTNPKPEPAKKPWLGDSDSDSDEEPTSAKPKAPVDPSLLTESKPTPAKTSWLDDSDSDSDKSSKKPANLEAEKTPSIQEHSPKSVTPTEISNSAQLAKKKSWLDESNSDSDSDNKKDVTEKSLVSTKSSATTGSKASSHANKKSWDSSDDDSTVEPLTRKKSMVPVKHESIVSSTSVSMDPPSINKTEEKLKKEFGLRGSYFKEPEEEEMKESFDDTLGKGSTEDDPFVADPFSDAALSGAEKAKEEDDAWQAALLGLANELREEKKAGASISLPKEKTKSSKEKKDPDSPKKKKGKSKSKDTVKSPDSSKKSDKKKKKIAMGSKESPKKKDKKSKDSTESKPPSKKHSKKNLVVKPASTKLVVAPPSSKKLVKNAFDDDSFMNTNDFDDDFSAQPDFGDFASVKSGHHKKKTNNKFKDFTDTATKKSKKDKKKKKKK